MSWVVTIECDPEPDDTCVVCLEKLDRDSHLYHTPAKGAKHGMHVVCLCKWLHECAAADRPLTCPVCRSETILCDLAAWANYYDFASWSHLLNCCRDSSGHGFDMYFICLMQHVCERLKMDVIVEALQRVALQRANQQFRVKTLLPGLVAAVLCYTAGVLLRTAYEH